MKHDSSQKYVPFLFFSMYASLLLSSWCFYCHPKRTTFLIILKGLLNLSFAIDFIYPKWSTLLIIPKGLLFLSS